jgi:hypothetical protein
MHKQRIPEGSEESTGLDHAVLDLLLDAGAQRPLAEAEIVREVGIPGEVSIALRRLRVAGLIHRWNDLVTASRAAVRFKEVTEPPDADLEFITRRHDRPILELLLSDAGNEPLSEKDIRRLLDVTKDEKAVVVEALDRLDAAGLVDRKVRLVVASEPARRFASLRTL